MIQIKCSAAKCLWNVNNGCSKDEIAIQNKDIYQYDKIIATVIVCASFSDRELSGHLDASQFPKR